MNPFNAPLRGLGRRMADGIGTDIAAIDSKRQTRASRAATKVDRYVAAATGDIEHAPILGGIGRRQSSQGRPKDRAAAAQTINSPQTRKRAPVKSFVEIGLLHQFRFAAPILKACEHCEFHLKLHRQA
jgi:hypothetical protein